MPLSLYVKDQRGTNKVSDLIKDKKISVICKVSNTFTSFVLVAKHKYGNKIYGIDSDNFRIKYKEGKSGYRLKSEDCPEATDNNDDLKGWIYIGQLEPHRILLDF